MVECGRVDDLGGGVVAAVDDAVAGVGYGVAGGDRGEGGVVD